MSVSELIRTAMILFITLSCSISAIPQEEESSSAEKTVLDSLQALGLNASKVSATPISGIYEVETNDGNFFYSSEDGKYVLVGELHRIEGTSTTNLTEISRGAMRKELLQDVPLDESLNFAPKEDVEHVVYVFTDVDCGYCRLLHENIEGYKARGIEIRYLAYPRAGKNSKTYNKMVSAWCADDPNVAIAALKRGETIQNKSCDNPIDEQFELGSKMNISGTPALILESGAVIPGYVTPERLERELSLQPSS